MVKMKSVSIVTDTTACIPREYIDRYHITIVPVQMIIDNRSYRDGIDITPDEFYTLLRQAEKIPTTSSSSPAPYLEAFKEASQQGRSIICLTEPARFTAMFNAAKIAQEVARNILPGITIEVIECSTAAAGQGLVAMNAARLADDNGSLEEIIDNITEIMPRVNIVAALDTLNYLAKSGRVPQVAARFNSVLNLKPVFTLNHGEPRMVALPTNTKNAVKRIMKLLEKEVAGARLHAAVMHADAPNPAQELLEQITDRFRCEEIFITEFTPVMGTHTGPGLFGVAFYTEPSQA